MAILAFGSHQLDTRTLELRHNGRKVRLRPQPCRVLAMLALRAGELVTREELKAAVWSDGVHVRFDVGLNSCLKQIRAALGESFDAPRFVETLRCRGYRFIGEVRFERTAQSQGIRRLAVLPFRTVDRSGENAAPRSEGFSEEVSVCLSRQTDLRIGIVARSTLPDSIVQSPSLRALRGSGVDLVLEGRIQIEGSALRVSVQLIDAFEQLSLWAQTYDVSADDIFAAQQFVARSISADLRGVLADSCPFEDKVRLDRPIREAESRSGRA